jgi:hypothetical protein
MERSDERLSTRDIASPSTTDDPRFDREDPAAETTAPQATRDTMADPVIGTDNATTAEPVDAERVDAEPVGTERATTERTAEPARTTTSARTDDAAPLVDDSEGFQSRWEEIQVRFVDEPRGAVEDADALVATVMQRLAEGFAQERERLEAQWGRGEDISTEDLRVSLQRYRSFFQRLLAT